jgi:hypothetical protein
VLTTGGIPTESAESASYPAHDLGGSFRPHGFFPGPDPDETPPESPGVVRLGDAIKGIVTHYGASYQGSTLACGGAYDTDDPSIIAVGYGRGAAMPCGTYIQVCGPGGCIVGQRQDTCPGCGPFVIDLSEAGIAAVCGDGAGRCEATFQSAVLEEARSQEPAQEPKQQSYRERRQEH